MKHRLLLIALCVMLLSGAVLFTACGTPDITTTAAKQTTDAPATTTEAPTTTAPVTEKGPSKEEVRAMEMVETMFTHYAVDGGVGKQAYTNFTEYHNTDQWGYLWTNFSAVGMQYYVCKLDPDNQEAKDTFRDMINNFQYFRQYGKASSGTTAVKYHSGRGSRFYSGVGTCFFDDNIWVARNFLRAYEILGDTWYLEEAIRVNNWVISGWNNELGGLVWSEDGLRDDANEQNLERGLSANACAIIVNAQLAALASSEEDRAFHLEWADKFYTFCKQMQNTPISRDYWNGIHTIIVNGKRENGTINKAHYSYNSASMILANLELYELETDEAKKASYLEDAIETAKAAKKTFYKVDAQSGKRYFQGDPWFAAILAEAYYELGAYDKPLADSLINAFNVNVTAAYQNRDSETGLFPYQATKKNTFAQNESWCIHQLGVAQQAVIIALYKKEAK